MQDRLAEEATGLQTAKESRIARKKAIRTQLGIESEDEFDKDDDIFEQALRADEQEIVKRRLERKKSIRAQLGIASEDEFDTELMQ